MPPSSSSTRHKKKKARTGPPTPSSGKSALDDKSEKIPKALILRRGKTAPEVGDLVHDLRELFLPYSALHFHEDARNRKLTLHHYVSHLALPMGVSHLWSFSQNQERLHLRIARTPEGPTLHFRVHQFSLARHIKQLQRRPVAMTEALTAHSPVVVTHQFGDVQAPPHVKLIQNMFPAIHVSTVQLKHCRRVVLFHYLPSAGPNEPCLVHMRQYAIQATPTGVHRRVRRLVQGRKLPNLHQLSDIADYLDANGGSVVHSDSEGEDDPETVVALPDAFAGRGNIEHQTSALKLVELGPRLTLELIKVEKGLGKGDVLYHSYIHKSPEEVEAMQREKERLEQTKEERRRIQEQNVLRKRQAAQAKKEAKQQRKLQREQEAMEALRAGKALEGGDDSSSSSSSSSSDEDSESEDDSQDSENE
jgi:ribosome biogenesis protein SSF1/2